MSDSTVNGFTLLPSNENWFVYYDEWKLVDDGFHTEPKGQRCLGLIHQDNVLVPAVQTEGGLVVAAHTLGHVLGFFPGMSTPRHLVRKTNKKSEEEN
jgi:hypothetical protein